MTSTSDAVHIVRFGTFELDLKTGELRRKGVKVALQEQPFQVLAMLVARPGDLVTREELHQKLWPDAVFVDFDHGLNKAVGKIRRALADLADSPRYVETLERRGYRFIAPAEEVAPGTAGATARQAPPTVVRLIWDDRSIPLADGEHLIGRDPAATIWIDSSTVSHRHATITVSGRSVTIEDLGSRNGTFVNDCRLGGVSSLSHNDEVRVGPARLTVRSAPTSEPTLPEDGQ
jgi:DNA-binding winged helix-turn-helix (wHTH) protein